MIMYIGIVDGSIQTIKELQNLDRYAFSCNAKYRNYGWRILVHQTNQCISQQSHSLDDRHQSHSNISVFKTRKNQVNMMLLTLDISQQSLSVIVNDERNSMNPFKKFENVDLTGLYRMALSMRYPGTKIEIFDFQIT